MPKFIIYKFLLSSGLFSFIMLLIWGLFNTVLTGSVWEGMTISQSAVKVEYCEFNHVDKLFHQPMNTYSNIAYFFFGVLILQWAWEDYKKRSQNTLNRLQQFPLLSALMGVCFVYLSFGSAFFHASLTWVGQRVDMNGTYSISLALLSIGLYHVLHKIVFSNQVKNIWIIALGVLILAFFKVHLMVSSGILLPVLILLNLVLTVINYVQFRKERSILWVISSLILMVIAVKIRTLDVQKMGCDPYSLYQGHSVWHLLTAISSFCSYAFFRFTIRLD
jgi:Ceramidase